MTDGISTMNRLTLITQSTFKPERENMNLRTIALVLLLGVGLNCRPGASTDQMNDTDGQETAGAEKSNLKYQIGDEPPSLNYTPLTSQHEETRSWADYRNRVVIIDFWATWCPPCIESIPHLNELVAEFKMQPVTFLSITYESEEMVERFLQKHPMNTTVGIDHNFEMFKSYAAWGIPMIFIIDKNGKIAGTIHPKYLTADVIRSVLAGETPKVEQHAGWPDPDGAETYFRSLLKKG